MSYHYGLLRTDLGAGATEHNRALLGSRTLGIEVTVPELARQCGLGNIDPQHGDGESASSAIERALAFSPLPAAGTTFVTIRPDRDSIGAMAIFLLREQGQEEEIDRWLVSWIGLADRMGFANARRKHPELMPADAVPGALQAIIQRNERWTTLAEKVQETARILAGAVPAKELADIAALYTRARGAFAVELHGSIALVRAPGSYHQARDWANQRYPVAVIHDPEYQDPSGQMVNRWSVIRQAGVFDKQGFEQAINAREAAARNLSVGVLLEHGLGWGGSQNITSSSQRALSELEEDEIIDLAVQHADSDQVS